MADHQRGEHRERSQLHQRPVDGSELLASMIECASEYAVFTIDDDGLVTSWNVGAERLIGYQEAEILGRPCDVMFTPEDRAAGAPLDQQRRALRQGRAEDESWRVRRNGQRFWGSDLLMPLAGGGRGFVRIIRDRTDQHSAETLLRESEQRFRLLATNIPQLVFRARGDGWRTWSSPQWVGYTGLGDDESRGIGWLDAVHPADWDRTVAAWRDARDAGEYYVEHRIRSGADDFYRWHQTRAKPLSRGDVEWVGTSTDIHELREMQEHQQVLVAELQHRTRNLLAVVQAIARQTWRSSRSFEHFVTEFESRLRALSRVQGLVAGAEGGDIDLRELVLVELEAHGCAPDPDGRRVEVDGPAVGLPLHALQSLALAVHELATNSVRYGAIGQPTARLSVTWTTAIENGERWLDLDWRETGVRMPMSTAPRRRGYGRDLIERALRYQLQARTALEFHSDGVRCRMAVPLGPEEESSHD